MSSEANREKKVEVNGRLGGDKIHKLSGVIEASAKIPVGQNHHIMLRGSANVVNGRVEPRPEKGGDATVMLGLSRKLQ